MRLAAIAGLALLLLHASTPGLLQLAAPAPRALPQARGPVTETAPTPEQLLAGRHLGVPVEGVPRARLQDTFTAHRSGGRAHRAIDIMAAWGTPVLAADDGTITRISHNRAGGLALYQTDASGQFVYYYAHLAGYADGLREGQAVRRGDVLAYVGTTGNASPTAPHLHFAVQRILHQGRWWKGETVNPYAALRQAPDASS